MTIPRFFSRAIAAALVVVLAPIFVLQPAVAAHDRVRFALVGGLTSLNPLFLNGFQSSLITELVFEPLLRLGPDLRFLPALATQEPSVRNGGISADGKRITFHLRPDTVWSDGTPVTASDVRFSIEQTLNPRNDIGSRIGFDQIAYARKGCANARNRSQRCKERSQPGGVQQHADREWPVPRDWLRGVRPSASDPFWNVYEWSVADP